MKTTKLFFLSLLFLSLLAACEEEENEPEPELAKSSFYFRQVTSDSLMENGYYYLSFGIEEESYSQINTSMWPTTDYHTYSPSCDDESAIRIWKKKEGANDIILCTLKVKALDSLANQKVLFEGEIILEAQRCRSFQLTWNAENKKLDVKMTEDQHFFD